MAKTIILEIGVKIVEEKKEQSLQLIAEEMNDINSMSSLAGFTTAATFGSVACIGSSASTAGSISSYGQ
ncbi:thiocillin family RiPP [Oceanobacillus sp. M65]|uniref:thiocillin family RiPP n=1 Tax=Oceanobacillus sp. M65 TaxID=3457435 RepID=UPI0025704FBD